MVLQVRKTLDAFRKRSWRSALGLLVLLIEEVALGLGRRALGTGWGWLRDLADRPLQEGGVVIVAALVIALLWAAVDPVRLWRERRRRPSAEEVAQLRKQIDDTTEQEEHWFWLYQWRTLPPDVGPLDAAHQREATIEIARLESSVLKPLADAIEEITGEMLKPLYQMPSDHLLCRAGVSMSEEIVQPTTRLLALLRKPKSRDARVAFKAFYERYRILREWIEQAAAFHDRPLSHFKSYAAWQDADAKFFAKVDEFPTVSGLEELKEFVRRHKQEGYPKPLPVGLSEKEQELDLALRQRSDSESQFLMLLREEAPSYDEPGTDLLSNAVYRAGRELARKGFFVCKELREGDLWTDLFTVPRWLAPFLKRSLFESSEMRMEIRLRLDRVAGSGASGSGARPSTHRW